MTQQEQFEEWALSQKWCINKTGDTYNNTYVGCSWQAWQAAERRLLDRIKELNDEVRKR